MAPLDDTDDGFFDLRRIGGTEHPLDHTDVPIGDLCRIGGPDWVVGWIARRQEGLVTRRQLLDAGLSRDMIRHRLRTGRLHQIHPGVYAAGHAAITPRARDLAAVLACGPGAVLSHASAAAYHEILPRQLGPVHVTRPNAPARHLDGVTLHRPRHLPQKDVLTQSAVLAVTTLTRTLLDLADHPRLAQALNEAQVRHHIDLDELRRRGRPTLRALLEEPTFTRSEAERRLFALITKAGLPRPRTNAYIHGHEVDFLWPEHRLVVEVDGYAYHRTRGAFEKDRHRDQSLTAAGYTVLRLTWQQITNHPERTAAALATTLIRRS